LFSVISFFSYFKKNKNQPTQTPEITPKFELLFQINYKLKLKMVRILKVGMISSG